MVVYRITLSKWANSLTGSGFPARWNSKGKFVIYTAGSTAALAALENLAHRSGEGLSLDFKLIYIEISISLKISKVKKSDFPELWYEVKNYPICQQIGDDWIKLGKTAVLEIPSSIIRNEFNYLINPQHKDLGKIQIKEVTDFEFDPRVKK